MGRLTMSDDEVDAFLSEERVLRLATLDDDGWPAVVPVWFVWHENAFWVWNLTRAKRTERLQAGTRCAFVVDGGEQYVELRGVSGRLTYAFVDDDAVPLEVRTGFSRKYFGNDHPVEPADHHQWIRFEPSTPASWDFRKQYDQGG
ncbi:MAG: pyridoxamine 5'-phosphate oxidase family protein [Nitriliruptoraceae bacterium]|nr:pyridoxamine 5'-phosphate oxidase family protein [Nitriliruptoraceae bacterium]